MPKPHAASCEGPEAGEWTRRLEVELDNLRAAIALALAGGVDPVIAVKFEVALMNFRILRGYSTEARKNIRAVLALPGLPDIARGHALYVGGALATRQGDYESAMPMLTECLALRRSLGDPREIAATLSTLALAHLQEGDAVRARECAEESLRHISSARRQLGEAIGLLHLGEICMQLADDAEARATFRAMPGDREKHQAPGDGKRMRALSRGIGACRSGSPRGARALYAVAQICRDAEDKRDEAIALWCLGKTETASGDHVAARSRLVEALRAFKELEMRAEALDCLEDCAVLSLAAGEPDRAVQLLAAAVAVRGATALPRSPRSQAKWEKNIDMARGVSSRT